MFDPNFFNTLFVIPILNALVGIYKLLLLLRLPGAFGLSLILLTALMRIILNPLSALQLKNTQKLHKLKPHLDKLSEKHKGDKQGLYQEQAKLYKEMGINPAAGCLPLLLQMPILIGLYNLFFSLLNGVGIDQVIEAINKVVYFPFLKISSLDLSFFGFNLAAKPSDWQTHGFILLSIPLITAVLQYIQTKMMTPQLQTTDNSPRGEAGKKQIAKEGEKKGEDMSATMQKQMAIMMPLMIGFFAYSFPLGLSLYWNTFTVFGIIQQYQINKQLEKE